MKLLLRRTKFLADSGLGRKAVHSACAVILAISLLIPFPALGNPIAVDPLSTSPHSPAFWALLLESLVVAGLGAFFGLAPFQLFLGYFLTNFLVFAAFFLPLLEKAEGPLAVLALEVCVVVLDAVILLFLSKFRFCQGRRYKEINWWRAGLVSTAGNATSLIAGWFGLWLTTQ